MRPSFDLSRVLAGRYGGGRGGRRPHGHGEDRHGGGGGGAGDYTGEEFTDVQVQHPAGEATLKPGAGRGEDRGEQALMEEPPVSTFRLLQVEQHYNFRLLEEPAGHGEPIRSCRHDHGCCGPGDHRRNWAVLAWAHGTCTIHHERWELGVNDAKCN